jgi:hypothetical protein
MGIFDRLLGRSERGRLGQASEPTTVDIHNRPLECQFCRHDYFWVHDVQLHTPVASFVNMEFANRTATCAICAKCGYIHWFLPQPS